MAAQAITSSAAVFDIMASMAAQEASNQRREQDWKFQKKLADQEIKQVQQQVASAAIRLNIAEKDLEIHDKQIEQTAEVHEFYKDKFTGLGLYNDLASNLSRLNRLAYNAALDLAKRAESAYRFETDDVQFLGRLGNWDAGRAGLLAGEHLALQLNQMDAAYLGQHTRRLEIRQTFSLRLLDPNALISLRTTGVCTFKIPEWAFDLQYPGQYRRRLMSVQITIPCVTGPYVNVAATLTMLNGSLKKDTLGDTLPFVFNGCSTVATSSANNDGGQFDLNFRDERYLPFEGAGAVDSEWNLELPGDYRSFDYNTISDVIAHLSYQAIGGGPKPTADQIKDAAGTLNRLISLKEEFPEAWYQLGLNQPTTITLSKKHFPFFAQANVAEITAVSVLGSNSTSAPAITNSWQITILPEHKNAAGDDVWLLIPYTL